MGSLFSTENTLHKEFLKEERTFFIKNTLPFTFDGKHHLPFIESWLRRCVFSDAHGVDPALFSLNWYSFPPIRNLTEKIHKKTASEENFWDLFPFKIRSQTSILSWPRFLCLFVDTLPVNTYLHIWDAFLFEGSKVNANCNKAWFDWLNMYKKWYKWLLSLDNVAIGNLQESQVVLTIMEGAGRT